LKNAGDILVPQVLIVDRDPAAARVLLEVFARRSIRGIVAAPESVSCQVGASFDMVFCCFGDQRTSLTSSRIIRQFKTSCPEQVIIAMLDADSSHSAIAAVKSGCTEVIPKPLKPEAIYEILDAFLPNHNVPAAAVAETQTGSSKIVGQSPLVVNAIETARRAARTSIPVMITGESGTGKELLASLVHSSSLRSTGPYIRLNCAALSDSLLESELFGHEKGAFTGAYARRKGRFERADGGTLLLDEITETPLRFQAELLRVIEQQDFERVGGDENVSVNVRLVSTTNKDIIHEMEKGRFRSDLYYRLAGVKVGIPPLRERRDDIPDLIWHFINLYARESGRLVTAIEPSTMEVLTSYVWPGNVRQLRNVIRTALVLGSGNVLSPADISLVADELTNKPSTRNSDSWSLAGRPLHEIEQQAIMATLRQTSGNQARAARTLGISDRTLREKIKKYRRQGDLQLTA